MLISVTVGYVASSVVERVDTSLTTSHMDTGCVDFVVSGFASNAAVTGCDAGHVNGAALWWTRC